MNKVSIFASALLLMGFWGCQSSKQSSSVIGKIGGDPVYSDEFKYVYNKNNSKSEDAYSRESIEEYLKLYTNFRLKVKEAESLGLDTVSAFLKELNGYKKQLAQPYFSEEEIIKEFTRISYERMKEEVNASHILIMVDEEASPADTLEAWNKISEIRKKAVKGEDFAELARTHSSDPSAKKNDGNLGYFTSQQMVYQFEDAAYNTAVGEVSQPVRTRFGYHILKVHDKRPSRGEVKVAHLMVRATEGMPSEDSLAAKDKIDELYKKVQAGEDWETLVKQFSDDVNTRDKGGELQWFGTGRMIPSFQEAAFAIKEPGQYSKPVQTPYGWHIIKLLETKGLADFEELEPTIKSKVARDRSEVNKQMLISRLKRENGFEENTSNVEKVMALADSSLMAGNWKVAPQDDKMVLFSMNKKAYTANDFIAYVKERQKVQSKSVSSQAYINSFYEPFMESSIISYEEEHLEDKYEDYRMLVKEYRDGILLFQLMDEKVWSKAIQDTTGLKTYFEENRDKYQWQKRVKAIVFNAVDSATLKKIESEYLQRDYYPSFEPQVAPVLFPENSDSLSYESIARLARLVPFLKSHKPFVVKISGNASSKEPLELAKKRAEKVKEYFKLRNIDTVKIVYGNFTKPAGKVKENDEDRNVSFEILSESAKSLEKEFNKKAPLTLQVEEGYFEKGENEIIDEVTWEKGAYTFEKDGRYYLVLVESVEDPRPKRLDETRGMVISDYQEYLEQQWIEQLKGKYTVDLNQKEIDKLIKD